MAAVYSTGVFTIPGSSSAAITVSSITWSDGGSYTPTALFLQGGRGTLDSTLQTVGSSWSVGATDGTNQACIGAFAPDANADSFCGSTIRNTGCLGYSDSGTLLGLLGFTSFTANQFVVTPSTQFPAAWEVSYIVFANTTGALVKTDTISTGTGTFAETDVGFQGDTGFFALSPRATINTNGQNEQFSLGFVDSSGGIGGAFHMTFGSSITTDYVWQGCSTTTLMARLANSAAGFADRISFTSWDANGYTLNHNTASGTAYQYFALILKGTTSKVVSTAPTSGTGTFDVPVTGVNPKCCLLVSDGSHTASSDSGTEGGGFIVGMHTAAAQSSFQYEQPNRETLSGGQTTEIYQRRTASRTFDRRLRTGVDTWTIQGHITKSAFTSGHVELNQTDGDPTAVLIVMLAMGDAVAGTTPPVGAHRFANCTFGVHKKKRNLGLRQGVVTMAPPAFLTGGAGPGPSPSLDEMYLMILNRRIIRR